MVLAASLSKDKGPPCSAQQCARCLPPVCCCVQLVDALVEGRVEPYHQHLRDAIRLGQVVTRVRLLPQGGVEVDVQGQVSSHIHAAR